MTSYPSSIIAFGWKALVCVLAINIPKIMLKIPLITQAQYVVGALKFILKY